MALGNLWEPGSPVEEVLRSADLALVFGSKLGAQDTEYQRMPLPSTIVRVDIDPEEIGRNYTPTQAIVADAALTARALVEHLAARGVSKEGWTPVQVADIRQRARAVAGSGHAPLHGAPNSSRTSTRCGRPFPGMESLSPT